jgi:protein-tyrosine phosphatase
MGVGSNCVRGVTERSGAPLKNAALAVLSVERPQEVAFGTAGFKELESWQNRRSSVQVRLSW